ALVESDDDVLAGVLEVQRVGVPLAPVADDRDLLPAEEREVRVLVVVDLRWHLYSLLGRDPVRLVDEARYPWVLAALGLPTSSLRVGRLAERLLGAAPRRLGTSRNGHLPGPNQLLDAHRPQELDDRGQLGLLPRGLERIRGGSHVDHLGPEDIGNPE